MNKMKISATVRPDRLEEARRLTGSDNVSEVIDRALAALITAELERIHADGYARVPQEPDDLLLVDGRVWAAIPWDDE